MAPRGFPDGADVVSESGVVVSPDLGELAVRLGSVVSYHRSGNVFWLEDFENGLRGWYSSVVGALGWVKAVNTFARSGTLAMELYCASGLTSSSYASHKLTRPSGERVGLELSVVGDAGCLFWQWGLDHNDGAYLRRFAIRATVSSGALEYWGADAAWHAISGITLSAMGSLAWLSIKLVVDLAAHEYVRLLVGRASVELSDMACGSSVDTTVEHLVVWTQVDGGAFETGYMCIDDVILTQNEPA